MAATGAGAPEQSAERRTRRFLHGLNPQRADHPQGFEIDGRRPLNGDMGDGLKTVRGTALPFAFQYRQLAKDFTVYVFKQARSRYRMAASWPAVS